MLASLLAAAALCAAPGAALGAAGSRRTIWCWPRCCWRAPRASSRAPSRRVAGARLARRARWPLGAVLALAGLGLDGVRGQHGTLRLSVGQARNHFDEVGPEGRPLGLRPLGFTVGVEGVTPEGGVRLALAGRAVPLEVTADRAAAFGGYRFAQPRVRATGGVARLRVSVTDGKTTEVADVTPGAHGPGRRRRDRARAVLPGLRPRRQAAAVQPLARAAQPRGPADGRARRPGPPRVRDPVAAGRPSRGAARA